MAKRTSPLGNPLSDPLSALPEIVMVYWRDSVYVTDHDNKEDAWPYILLYDTGFLVRDDAEGIVLATEIPDTDSKAPSFRHVSSIPRENIIKIQRFTPEVGIWPLSS